MRFWLGTHETSWLGRTDVPLFVSHRRLALRKRFPVALGPWALDSGGFTELNLHGRWVTTEADYVTAVRRYSDEIGQLSWAAPMDWMCEPFVLAKTGETVLAHQQHTVDNFLRLRDAAPDLPFVPVLQGWTLDDYRRCIDLYDEAGVDLRIAATRRHRVRLPAARHVRDRPHRLNRRRRGHSPPRLRGEAPRARSVRRPTRLGRFAGVELPSPQRPADGWLPAQVVRQLPALRPGMAASGCPSG